jgi:hypothetical protein
MVWQESKRVQPFGSSGVPEALGAFVTSPATVWGTTMTEHYGFNWVDRVDSQQGALVLSNLLLLLRPHRERVCYNFTELGTEHLHYFIIPIVWQIRLRPPVQLFQSFSHLNPALFTSFAMFTVWTVDS